MQVRWLTSVAVGPTFAVFGDKSLWKRLNNIKDLLPTSARILSLGWFVSLWNCFLFYFSFLSIFFLLDGPRTGGVYVVRSYGILWASRTTRKAEMYECKVLKVTIFMIREMGYWLNFITRVNCNLYSNLSSIVNNTEYQWYGHSIISGLWVSLLSCYGSFPLATKFKLFYCKMHCVKPLILAMGISAN